jgi:phosphoribosylanthranilate isomerase
LELAPAAHAKFGSDLFRIKICGVTSAFDALAAIDAGADALGLNFYPPSPRCIDRQWATAVSDLAPIMPGSQVDDPPPSSRIPPPDRLQAQIAQVAAGRAVRVGLFVNADACQVCRMFDQLPLELLQLHGDEPPEYLAQLGGRPVMRAFRLGPEGLSPIESYLDRCRRLQCLPKLVLIDAHRDGQYGGTGQTADWGQLLDWPQHFPPLVLAGGLTPANVAQAIGSVRPSAVDTASGVEMAPGRKDPALMTAFVQAARAALALLAPPSATASGPRRAE